jgi:acyl carrier protein
MSDHDVRDMVIGALLKVVSSLEEPELAPVQRDLETNLAIADLGIDSLEAIEWCMEIEARSGVELDPVDLTTHGTIDELVRLVAGRMRDRKTSADAPPLMRIAREGRLPLSLGQESMWRYSQTPRTSAAYTLGLSDQFFGPLDVAALRESLSRMVQRHEILRTTYPGRRGAPAALIHPAEPVLLPLFDVSGEANPKETAAQIIKAELAKVVDVARGPLIRFSLVRLGHDEHWLLRVCHHMLWDLWSTGVFLDELAQLYNACIEGKVAAPPASEPLQFVDYAAWQRQAMRRGGPAYQSEVAWWKARWQKPVGMPDLPFKRSKPLADVDPADSVIRWPVDGSLAECVTRLRRREGTTPFVVWLAALVALLAAENRRPGVVVGTYAANRRRPEVQNMIGCFVNLVTLGFHVEPAMSFRRWLSEVRTEVAAAEAHCELPHAELQAELKKSGVAPPPVSLIFGVRQARADTRFAGLRLVRPDLQRLDVTPWGFSIGVLEYEEAPMCRAIFDARIYDPAEVRRFLRRLCDLLAAVSQEPDRPLGELLALYETA